VPQIAQRAELLLEPQDALRRDPAQRLERDLDATLAIERAIDDAHPTAPDRLEHLEAPGDQLRRLVHR
jgi:hypothetical protein